MYKYIIMVLVFQVTLSAYSQQSRFTEIDSLLKSKEAEKAFSVLNRIDTLALTKADKAEFFLLLGSAEALLNKHDLSFAHRMKSRKLYRELDSTDKVARINLSLAGMLNASKVGQLDPKPFVNEYLAYAEEQDDPALLSKAYMQIGSIFINSKPTETLRYFKLSLDENLKTDDSLMTAKIHHNLGVLYAEKLDKLDSALIHYNTALEEYEEQNKTDFISYIYNNRASVYKKKGDYDAAIRNYLQADSIGAKEYRKENKRLLYGWLSDAYEKNDDPHNALKFLKLQNIYQDSINKADQDKAMLDIQTKYEVERKENENLRLKQNRIWLWVAVGFLIVTLIIGLLFYKNLQKKKKIRDREYEMQRQKLENVLKEQELAGIDAMIEGQEKERQRIANDLHDNLGSLLATIRLHFQNMKIKKDRLKEEEDRMMKQTDDLIDEAYQQVRSMAHAKHAGVPAREGLLPAIKNFARKVSVSNQLVINVEDQGMNERLENTLEIAIFRMVQELVTNIIKHANAKNATIYLTDYEDSINIMVEDDGQGFDFGKIKPKEGMGVHSIQKRVEYMDGEIDFDSTPGKGTTVNITIPIK